MEKIIAWYPQTKQLHAAGNVKRQTKLEIKPWPQAFISTSQEFSAGPWSQCNSKDQVKDAAFMLKLLSLPPPSLYIAAISLTERGTGREERLVGIDQSL